MSENNEQELEGTFYITKWYKDGSASRVTYEIETLAPLHEDFDDELMKLVNKHDTYKG